MDLYICGWKVWYKACIQWSVLFRVSDSSVGGKGGGGPKKTGVKEKQKSKVFDKKLQTKRSQRNPGERRGTPNTRDGGTSDGRCGGGGCPTLERQQYPKAVLWVLGQTDLGFGADGPSRYLGSISEKLRITLSWMGAAVASIVIGFTISRGGNTKKGYKKNLHNNDKDF